LRKYLYYPKITNKHMKPILKTNEERAKMLGLRPAPTVKGYFFEKELGPVL